MYIWAEPDGPVRSTVQAWHDPKYFSVRTIRSDISGRVSAEVEAYGGHEHDPFKTDTK
jgi:hypothetical protein